ncbi:hypothetical protein [Streptomyces sp. TLI_185]|nr:hypothetical protein [Streptomyces sp. TLI_185]
MTSGWDLRAAASATSARLKGLGTTKMTYKSQQGPGGTYCGTYL